MKISSWAVKKPVSVIMTIVAIIVLGSVSLRRLPMDLLPKMNIPIAVVTTQYPGAGPFEIENMVTKSIEEAMAMVQNVKQVSSSSSENLSMVTVEFTQGTDMDFATLQMREKIDLIKNFLPEEVSPPMVLKVDPNALPVMILSVSGEGSLDKIQEIAEYQIKPRLERLSGVAAVNISGGYSERIEITVDPQKLKGSQVTMQHILALLQTENINLPGGEVGQGEENVLVRTVGQFKNLEEIKNLPMMLPTGIPILLGDLVDIHPAYSERQQISKLNGAPSIGITIQKQPIANTVQVANLISKEIKNLQKELEDSHIEVVIDQSQFIKDAIINVGETALYGGILAIIVLYLFLRNVKTTIIIGLAIPISIMATFTLMYFSKVTLNLLSLGGLALGVGMLVDNGIVVLENIYRFREKGQPAFDASIRGAKEVAMAVSASTFTTVAVFLPIAFIEGMTAEIFRELALTVSFSLLASLFVSLSLVPMLSSKILKKITEEQLDSKRITSRFENSLKKLGGSYRKMLYWSLSHRKTIISFTILIFVFASTLLLIIGAEYFPNFNDGTFTIDVTLPQGTTMKETENFIDQIVEKLQDYEEINSIFSNVGSDGGFGSSSTRSNKGSINGKLVESRKRNRSTDEILDGIRKDLEQIAGGETSVSNLTSSMGIGGGGSEVVVEIRGDDLEVLSTLSEDFTNMIKSVEGTREVTNNIVAGRDQMDLILKRHVASRYGLQSGQVATYVRNMLTGTTATKLRVDGKERDVIIKGADYLRESLDNFILMPISTPLGTDIPLDQIADLQPSLGPGTIRRNNQVRITTISAAIVNRDLNSVIMDIDKKLKTYSLPAGYSYQFRGQQEQLEEAFSHLIFAGTLAVLLVYMILASQFQSFLHPFIIMISVPLAFSGGIIALFITGRPLSVPAIIGMIVLAGIVVNNGIVLIDYINTLRGRGEELEAAVVMAGTTRLRPILMTTLTTILGLLPLSLGIGAGAEMQAPLATVVIGGLLLATLLTLIAIPVIYSSFDELSTKIK